jgi:hypothetical protein
MRKLGGHKSEKGKHRGGAVRAQMTAIRTNGGAHRDVGTICKQWNRNKDVPGPFRLVDGNFASELFGEGHK